jgi:hypothetical protein
LSERTTFRGAAGDHAPRRPLSIPLGGVELAPSYDKPLKSTTSMSAAVELFPGITASSGGVRQVRVIRDVRLDVHRASERGLRVDGRDVPDLQRDRA